MTVNVFSLTWQYGSQFNVNLFSLTWQYSSQFNHSQKTRKYLTFLCTNSVKVSSRKATSKCAMETLVSSLCIFNSLFLKRNWLFNSFTCSQIDQKVRHHFTRRSKFLLPPEAVSSLQVRTGSNTSHPDMEIISSLHLFPLHYNYSYTSLMHIGEGKTWGVHIKILNSTNVWEHLIFSCEKKLLVFKYARPLAGFLH